VRAMAVEGADVPLPPTLGSCAALETVRRTVVDPGFDEKSLDSKHIGGVDPTGPAYRAGIRNGQEVFRVSIYHDDPTKDVLLGVVVDGERKMIHYSATKQQTVAQYRATVQGNETQACTPF
jgi:predicted metalloprotease with PDZ domain